VHGGAGTSLAHDLASGTVIIFGAHPVSFVSPLRGVHGTRSSNTKNRGKRKLLFDFDISDVGLMSRLSRRWIKDLGTNIVGAIQFVCSAMHP
jgi:hypothetical protein